MPHSSKPARLFRARIAVVALGIVGEALATPGTGLTVPDLIEMTRIGSSLFGGFGGDEHVVSPDGLRIAVVTQQGDITRNTREFSLLVFNTADLLKHPHPDTVAEFSSSSNYPGIAQVAWWSDKVLAFLAVSGDAGAQIYTVDLETHKATQRTHAAEAVTNFQTIDGGVTLIYSTQAPAADTSGFAALRKHGFAIPTDVPVSDIIAGKWEQISRPTIAQGRLHTIRDGRETTMDLPNAMEFGVCLMAGWSNAFSVAPSGELALVFCRPKVMPSGWAQYSNEGLRQKIARGFQYPWWIAIDLRTGAAWPLTGGPSIIWHAPPRWTPDGRAVLLVHDYLPLDGVEATDRDSRAAGPLTAEVDVRSRAARIVPDPVSIASKSPVEIEEGPDVPWRLVAIDPRSRRKQIVYDPNPGLTREHRIADVTLLKWTVKSGAELTAGLYWPLDYVRGKRYPLAIQTHGFRTDKFAPDGYSSTGYAAQPLAADGAMVVQAYECTQGCLSPQRMALSEGQVAQQDLEGLIDHLDTLGLIDRSKVALLGYSRSCYQQLYFMTHSDYPIAAMACTDGSDESYLQYLIFTPATPALGIDFESHYGGPPFGPSLKTWLDLAPDFNLDHIHAPVQLTAVSDGSSVLGAWEPFAGLVLQGKPVELKFIPDAAHNIVKPWERVASQQNAVDWVRFWLQGYERTTPIVEAQETTQSLSDQYIRWHQLRRLQESNEEAHK